MIPFFPGIYCEGPTDERFFPALIERVIYALDAQNNNEAVEVYSFVVVRKGELRAKTDAERLLEAARICRNCQILFVHLDRDAQSLKEARKSRFHRSAKKIAAQTETAGICRRLVPIIPDRMMEAWLLADWKSVLAELHGEIAEADLRRELKLRGRTLPESPRQAESDPDPKQTLEQIIKIVCGRRNETPGDLYEDAARRVNLDSLRQLKAFQQFESELATKLVELRLI